MLVQNGVVGLVLVVLVMSLFFRPAYAAWAAMGLPVAFLGAFAWMSLTGESLNMITVVALLMAIGIVMDDSIVLSDSIAVHSHGNVTLPSVVQGVVAVAPGVVSSFLTTVSVFLPLSFLAGELGAVLEVLPVVLLAALTASLVEAFFILPHHLKQSLTKSNYSPNKFKVRFEEIFNSFKERGIGRLADWAIDHRWLVVGVAIGLLIITIGALGSGVVKREAMPEIDGDVIEARILLPMGVSLARTEEAVRQVEDALARVNIELKSKQPQQQDLVKRVITRFGRNLSVGESGSHVATVSADLLSAEIRDTTLDELIEIWKREIGVLPGITSLILTEPGIGPQGIAVELRLFHEDLDLLSRASQDLLSEVEKYYGVLNAKHDLNVGKPQLGMQITSDGQALGLTPLAIANQLRGAFLGETLDDIRVGELQYAIEVKFADDSTQDINDLLAFELLLNDGSTVLLPNVVKLYETREWSSVTQRNGARSVTIQADVDGRIANADAITADIKKNLLPNIQSEYSGITFEIAGQAANSTETVASILRGFLIGIVGVYLILSFQFRSYVEPFIVLLTIPMAFLGVVWGHYLMGYNISMPSLVGAASLSGIVVNNAILLIGVIKERVSDTKSVIDAASEAVRSRFRPIFVSVSTTIMGMAPLLTETSTQAQTLKPLVISVVFGLLASTVLVMIVVPSLYAIVNDLKSKSSTN
jgi:multidrug efflux pump subunit AcrB